MSFHSESKNNIIFDFQKYKSQSGVCSIICVPSSTGTISESEGVNMEEPKYTPSSKVQAGKHISETAKTRTKNRTTAEPGVPVPPTTIV